MKTLITILILFLGFQFGFSQKTEDLNYYKDIEPILSKNCVGCHSPNNVGPFSLQNYQDVTKRAEFINLVIGSKYMPPFPANKNFQEYKNVRGLSNEEIETINSWIGSGMKEGKKKKGINEIKSFELAQADKSISMAKPYQIQAENKDDFRYFHIPTNLGKDEYLSAIEFKPGNNKAVHHSRIMVDTTNLMRGIDGLSETDSSLYKFQKYALKDEFLYGWVPGNDKIEFPKGTGLKLNANSDFLLNMHYSPSPITSNDQSSINLFFSKSNSNREVKSLILRENDISNQPFLLKQNTKPKFYIAHKILKDISLISIMPHMHQLGKSIRAFAVSPIGEVTNLIEISNWDFNWQMTYQFKKLILLKKGSIIYVEAEYDNTKDNYFNKGREIKEVGYGWRTQDEMLNLVMYYLDYQIGDENTDQ